MLRRLFPAMVVILCAMLATPPITTHANSLGVSRTVGPRLAIDVPGDRIRLTEPALPSLAHARFCLRYPDDCKPVRAQSRRRIRLTDRRLLQLAAVNLAVNHAIIAERQDTRPVAETWIIRPERGDCNDYAVTKRHELLALGWPSSALLLAEVVTEWGEHHLVLVVRTREGDFVLDNLASVIRHWSLTPYRWIKMQSPRNPNFWWTVGA